MDAGPAWCRTPGAPRARRSRPRPPPSALARTRPGWPSSVMEAPPFLPPSGETVRTSCGPGPGRPCWTGMASLGWRRARSWWTAPSACAGSPFLELLIPASLHRLPPGWWEYLLRSQDADGRLLPEGPLDLALPWSLLQSHAGPLVLEVLPEALAPHASTPWLTALPDGRWVLDPHLRAWARGFGASAAGLAPLAPDGLASGAPPDPPLAAFLHLRLAEDQPRGWRESLEADIQEALQRPGPPPPSGHPTWDRIRMRWGGEAAGDAEAYPRWGTRVHPCADPFHWMAEGLRADGVCDPEASLRAFTLAHAHFLRVGATGWAERAASNAAHLALKWADLPAHARWVTLRGPLPQPWQDLEEAQLAEVNLAPEAALTRIRRLVEAHPGFPAGWGLLALHGADRERWDLVREGLVHVQGHPYARFLQASLGPLTEDPPGDADPETRLSWEAHRLFRGSGDPRIFWEAWRACPTQIMRLDLGLQVLERRPDLRSAA